jgi:Ca-activated chloride channel family protein
MILMHLKTIALLGMGSALFLTGFKEQKKSPGGSEDSHTIHLEVAMVSLPVVVTDKEGRRITDLQKEDFQVFENGVQQEIAGFAATDEPVDVALLLDTSGSTEYDLAKIQNAAIDFVNELHPDDEVAVLSFAEDVRLQTDFSIDRDKNEYGIKKTRPGGCTVAYEAVWLALEEVLKPIQERKALVFFTDGVDTCSRKASEKETLDLAKETKATIYCVYYNTESDIFSGRRSSTIGGFPPVMRSPLPPVYGGPGSTGIDYANGRSYLKDLSEYSGGLVLDGMKDLRDAFAQVAKELASQYSIGYYSSDPKNDGKFRKIEVKVSKPGLVARTKKGYFAKKDKTK